MCVCVCVCVCVKFVFFFFVGPKREKSKYLKMNWFTKRFKFLNELFFSFLSVCF